MVVDPRPTHISRTRLEGKALLAGDVLKDPEGLGHHFRSYVVSREYGELEGRHVKGVYRYPLQGQR